MHCCLPVLSQPIIATHQVILLGPLSNSTQTDAATAEFAVRLQNFVSGPCVFHFFEPHVNV